MSKLIKNTSLCCSTGDHYDVSEAKIAEKRKYCDYDKSNSEITWTYDDDSDANSTTVYPNVYSNNKLKCPDEFVIQSIYLSGNGDRRSDNAGGHAWLGVDYNAPYLASNGWTANWWTSRYICEYNQGDMISFHSLHQQQTFDRIIGYSNDHFYLGLTDKGMLFSHIKY